MSNIAEKIEKQIISLQKKIDALSGSYLTNTWKRQQEQKHRDRHKEQLGMQKQMLEYLAEESLCRSLTGLENAILSGAFYENMQQLPAYKKHCDARPSNYSFRFPEHDEKAAKRLRKADIHTTEELIAALSEYGALMDKSVIPQSPNAARIRDLTFETRLAQRGDIQFTPEIIANRIVNLSGIRHAGKVLEPSAGIGSIADCAKRVAGNVDCIEPAPKFRELLNLKGHTLIGADIFECVPNPVYDAVVMNPPFSDECRHIEHAFGFVKPGGRLVSVCSVRIRSSEQKKFREFREWLNERDFHFENITEKFEATGVNADILVIESTAA